MAPPTGASRASTCLNRPAGYSSDAANRRAIVGHVATAPAQDTSTRHCAKCAANNRVVIYGVELVFCVLYAILGVDERGYDYLATQDLVCSQDNGDLTDNHAVREFLRLNESLSMW